MSELDREEQKTIFKEAIKEWLDEKYTLVGKWTVHGFLAACVVGLCYLVLLSHGWSVK